MRIRKLKAMTKRIKRIDFENPDDISFLFWEVAKHIYNTGIVVEVLDDRLKKLEGKKK